MTSNLPYLMQKAVFGAKVYMDLFLKKSGFDSEPVFKYFNSVDLRTHLQQFIVSVLFFIYALSCWLWFAYNDFQVGSHFNAVFF